MCVCVCARAFDTNTHAQGAEEMAENILFSTDEDVLCTIEEHDVNDVNVNPTSCEVLFLSSSPPLHRHPPAAHPAIDGGCLP